ncbi:MAG: YbcC family protein [Cyclobacteriaceae bacterium]
MVKLDSTVFDEHDVLDKLKHYLPAQAPLKDFVHHNTLHGFQHSPFDKAIFSASAILGYKVSLTLAEYRHLYATGRIRDEVLNRIIINKKGEAQLSAWRQKLLSGVYHRPMPRVGTLRSNWKKLHQVDLDSLVHPLLFRILCSYLDQGIAIWNFPVWQKGFLASIRELERTSLTSFFRSSRAKELLLKGHCSIVQLLRLLVGFDTSLYEHYLFDQQFAHQGWSGMVAVVEDQPETLLDKRKISLHDLIVFELLLEIDALDFYFGPYWLPLEQALQEKPEPLFADVPVTELDEVTLLWQQALEWSYYDQVLAGLQLTTSSKSTNEKSFQAVFCIDDRECSLRRYLEQTDVHCETFGTPGFFGVEFYFQPDHGKFYDKLCPAPVTPKHLIKEVGIRRKHQRDSHFTPRTHSLIRGWLITQTLGFWSAFKLFINIFRPSISPATATSFQHMHEHSRLTIECRNPEHKEKGLQLGFTVEEMTDRVEVVLKSIGLVNRLAPLVYIVGHGASSVNNPHYAAYDCGACSGRAGSVNARVFSFMANHSGVRSLLEKRGLSIPPDTRFMGALHDTTRDEIVFFDEDALADSQAILHEANKKTFHQALRLNAKERSRRFYSVNTQSSLSKIHHAVKLRSVSLFEPRPELNHATNALCIIGRRQLTRHLFLDRRAFLNSYDYRVDPDGKYLLNIVKAAAPVCGGINLEYFFSRTDNQKLGAGTKLPHNVMGLFGVANGIDGDLRPGLPSQMIEIHEPVRLLMVIEHYPEVVRKTIQHSSATYEWFIHQWIHLVVVHPETLALYLFDKGSFIAYKPLSTPISRIKNVEEIIEKSHEDLPVYELVNSEQS